MTDRNDGRPKHSASHMHCAVPFFCARSGMEGEAAWRSGEWVVRAAGNASRSLRACVGAAWGSGSARRGRVAVRGRAKGFGGEWVVRSAGLTHIRRSSTRARVLLYIRPPCPRREIAAMGPKDAPASTHRPRRLPYPPRLRLHFRARVHTFPVRVHTSPAQPSAPPRGAIGLPPQQLSTMGYPRKSYPHRCPQPCAKRSRPRVCARVYIIYRSPVGRSRGVSAPLRKRVRAVVPPCPAPPSAGWGRAKAKADAPSRSAEPLPACVPNHCAQRRKCTRPTPPLPVRSPRVSPPTAAPPPVDGRTAECRVGRAKAKADVLSRSNPHFPRLPPCPRRLNGSPATVGGRENDRMAHRRTATPTHRTPRGNDTCTIRVP